MITLQVSDIINLNPTITRLAIGSVYEDIKLGHTHRTMLIYFIVTHQAMAVLQATIVARTCKLTVLFTTASGKRVLYGIVKITAVTTILSNS